jgi:transposase
LWYNTSIKLPKLSHQQIQELRKFNRESKKSSESKRAQAVLLLDKDVDIAEIGLVTELGRSQIFNLRSLYIKNGIDALRDKRTGKPKELLTKKQREKIIETVKSKTPKQLGYVSDYWTTGILGDWIDEKYKTKYKSKTSLYLVFKKASFSYHRPITRYDLRDEKEVEEWKKRIKSRLKKLDAHSVVLAGDEMILTTETTIQRVWLPQGEYPKIEVRTGGRKRRSIYGFLNLRTGQEHAFKTEYQNMFITAEILKQVREKYPNQHILLLWDSAGWHKGSVVQEYLKQDKNIEILHFPRYAPEENPQEHVWKSGRGAITHNRYIEDIDRATNELVAYFNKSKFNYEIAGLSLIS